MGSPVMAWSKIVARIGAKRFREDRPDRGSPKSRFSLRLGVDQPHTNCRRRAALAKGEARSRRVVRREIAWAGYSDRIEPKALHAMRFWVRLDRLRAPSRFRLRSSPIRRRRLVPAATDRRVWIEIVGRVNLVPGELPRRRPGSDNSQVRSSYLPCHYLSDVLKARLESPIRPLESASRDGRSLRDDGRRG